MNNGNDIKPDVLILSNRHDFASDYVCSELKERGIVYLRLNNEDLPLMELNLYPLECRLSGNFDNVHFDIESATLKSIYFRRPTFLRDNYKPDLSLEEQLGRTQWAAFYRGLMIFGKCRWVNHPKATYAAESKPYQLYLASSLGFTVPKSLITNTDDRIEELQADSKDFAIKGLDSVLLTVDKGKAFVYTNKIDIKELRKDQLATSPVIVQEYLEKKIDLRVTVIGDKVFSVYIKHNGAGVKGDWRLMKNEVEYEKVNLPNGINRLCIALVKKLGLCFGAIDLAEVDGVYYFLEINPTGEWAWLVDRAKLPIDKAIADVLR